MKKVKQRERSGAGLIMIILLLFVIFVVPGQAARISGMDESNNPVFVEDDVDINIEEPAIVEPPFEEAAPGVPAREKTLLPDKSAKETVPPKKAGSGKEDKKPSKATKKSAPTQYVTLDFDNVEIGVLVKFVSELTGKNFLIDDKVKGKITIMSPKKIPVDDVYKVFLSILEVNGFTVVPAGSMTKIIPSSAAREKGLETRTKNEPAGQEDRMVTQIIALERANPDEIKRVLDPIVPKTGSVLAYSAAGMLVVTDYLSNIKRLQEIVAALDVEGAGNQISYIPLVNASASEVVRSLTTIFAQTTGRGATGIKAVADTRTNAVILMASGAETQNVRKLVDFMDKEIASGASNIQVYRLQNSNAEDLAKVLTSIVKEGSAQTGTPATPRGPATTVVAKNVQIVPDKFTNSLVVMAEREDYKVIENIIKQLDVPRPMVYIEALIMEVDANKDFKLGVEWRGITEHGSVDGTPTAAFAGSGGSGTGGSYSVLDSLLQTAVVGTTAVTTGAFPPGFAMGMVGAGIKIGDIIFPSIGAVVQAYKTDSAVSILSTPQIMTMDNEEAEINVGSNVPYLTRQDTTSSTTSINYNSYEYKDVGVILNITPHINEENFIRLKISQEVTKIQSGADKAMPTTLKRKAKTTVVVKDKETVVIGGLVGDATQEGNYRIPLLGDIPLLGWLFRTKTRSREKTNLYVFLTPHIVRNQADAARLYQEKRATLGDVVEGIIKINEKNPEVRSPGAPVPEVSGARLQNAPVPAASATRLPNAPVPAADAPPAENKPATP
jgi:general secretion pathway protein D